MWGMTRIMKSINRAIEKEGYRRIRAYYIIFGGL
jgi:hypothetical protein